MLPHFADKETEAQQDELICLRSQTLEVVKPGHEHRQSSS